MSPAKTDQVVVGGGGGGIGGWCGISADNAASHAWTVCNPYHYYTYVDCPLVSKITKTSTLMSLRDAFVNLITSEPMKSFRKAGIVNGDNLLTSDGERVFLNWLLSKNSDAFLKEVVQPILDEQKKDK